MWWIRKAWNIRFVTSDGKQYPAKVLARDPSNDIAIVKIEAQNLPVAGWAIRTLCKSGRP